MTKLMTKQEYEAKRKLLFDKQHDIDMKRTRELGMPSGVVRMESERHLDFNRAVSQLKSEYITSLESTISQLTADNASLIEQVKEGDK